MILFRKRRETEDERRETEDRRRETGDGRREPHFLRPTIFCLWSFIFLIGLFLFPACEGDTSTKIKLSYSERRAVDTLYKERILLLSPILDSICDANFEKEVQATIDSILQMRRADEMRLRKKIPIEGQ